MSEHSSTHFKAWELALLCALCLTLCAAAWAQKQTERISSSLIRLHVLAVDDSAEEQALKLRVRDAVLDFLSPRLEGIESKTEAAELLSRSLPELQSAAAAAAGGRQVTVTLTREYYPTRTYGRISLPAGGYDSLRVVLGKGEGRNWWCVVFPPLCAASAADAEAFASLVGEKDAALLRGEGRGCVLKFHLIELWELLRAKIAAAGKE